MGRSRPEEGSLQVFEIFRCSNSRKKYFYFYFLQYRRNPHSAFCYWHVQYLVMILFFLLFSATGLWFWLAGRFVKIIRQHNWPLTNPTLLEIDETPAASYSTFISISISIIARNSYFLKNKRSLWKHFKKPLVSSLRLDQSNFRVFFNTNLVTQSL